MLVGRLAKETHLLYLKKLIRGIPDFPKPGIIFRDITPLLKDESGFRRAISIMVKYGRRRHADIVASIESRGFILGSAVALKLGCGFVPVRKKGKLPWQTVGEEYQLEYGTDYLEVHQDAFKKGQRVLLVDDVMATGGTLQAAARLIEKLGAKVAGIAVLVELTELKGIQKLTQYDVLSILKL